MMMRPTALALASALVLVAPARADEENVLGQASALYDAGRFEEALRLLSRARPRVASRRERARIDLQRGVLHAVLGQEEGARAAFVEALRGDPRADLDDRVHKAAVVTLFRETRARLRGRIEIAGRDGLRVLIDGREAGRTPLRLALPIGQHRIEVRTDEGRALFRQEVQLLPDGRERVWVPEAIVQRASTSPATAPATVPRRRVWTWVAVGATALEAGACLGLYLWARSGYDEYLGTADPHRYDELASGVPGRYRAAQAMLGVTLATAAASVVLYLVEGRTASRETRTALSTRGLRLSF